MFLISVFGTLFAVRTYQKELGQGILSQKFLKTWLACTLLVIFLAPILFFGHNFAYWGLIFGLLMFLWVGIIFTKLQREQKFREELLNFIDRVLLQVQSGKSFRTSLQIANKFSPFGFKIKISQLTEAIVFSKDLDKNKSQGELIKEIFEEFKLVDAFPHKSLQRLAAFRRKLKIESEFRHKSSQKTRQIRLQTIILSFMYGASLFFVSHTFGFYQNQKIILISVLLFLAGTLLVFVVGRQKWRI